MESSVPHPNWSDPDLLSDIERAFEATWPALRGETADKHCTAELSMMLRHKLIELAAEGIREPEQMRKMALESFRTWSSRTLNTAA